MSGESQNMERSTLERKDRTELAAVANALGLKVPSRAKKADIVSLILDAVGQDQPAAEQPSLLDEAPAEVPAAEAPAQPKAPKPERAPATQAPAAAEEADASADAAPADATEADAADGESDDANAEHADNADDASGEGSGRRRRRRRGRDRGEGGEGAAQQNNGGQNNGQNNGNNNANNGGDGDVEPVEVQGLLDLREDGYGFLRVAGFVASREDVYVSVKQCRQLGLRKGDYLSGLARPATHKEKNPALVRVETVNGLDPEAARDRARFDDLTAIDADDSLTLGGQGGEDLTGELIDAIAPIKRGNRGLIVAPPTVDVRPVLTTVANAIEERYPDVHVVVLLVDERPEAVTSFRKSLNSGEIVSSTFERPADQHASVAELAIEHAKRLVEYGNDVVVLLDSLTGLTRAYNLTAPAGGRVIRGELDASALNSVKRVFGAGRNIEDGGSLTIIGTVLSETRSEVDEAIIVELQRGANSTLYLEAAVVPAPAHKLVIGATVADQKSLLAEISK